MILQSKFNFKDIVHAIGFTQQKIWHSCGFCAGSGKIKGKNDKSLTCPNCRGNRGNHIYEAKKWAIIQTLTIGEIRVKTRCEYKTENHTYFDNYSSQKALEERKYMCYETGIGSGTVWPEDQLFYTTATAQIECDRLNAIEADRRRSVRPAV